MEGVTKLADVVVPEVFTGPTIARATEKNEFIQSGIAQPDPTINIGEGLTIQLPFYNDLAGDEEVWTDTDDITVDKIDMDQDTAVVLTRTKAWGRADLTAALRSDDPADRLSELVSDYWARRQQEVLIALCKGATSAFSSEGTPVNVLDISGMSGAAAYLDGDSFIDATTVHGDRSDELTAVAMHSRVEGWLRKNDLIQDIMDSEGKVVMRTFQGRRVIIDDRMPFTGSGADRVFDTYLFAPGAVSYVENAPENATEVERDGLKNGGTDVLITRRKFLMHLRGLRWTPQVSVPAKATPSNAELADGGNWTRVWPNRTIKLVTIRHKVG